MISMGQKQPPSMHRGTMTNVESPSAWRELFEILREDLASATAAFSVFQRVELSLNRIVGTIDKAHATAGLLRELDGVTPEEPAMLLQMR